MEEEEGVCDKMSRVKLVIDKEYDNKIRFTLSGIDYHMANLFRRYAMSRIPIIAIDKVIFHDNTSSFFDEYIAHRIGMIPIKTPKRFPKSGTVHLILDVEGPKQVYSGDFIPDKDIEPALPDIPIIPLTEGQKLKLEGVGVLGLGANHMKFQASITSYEQVDDSTFKFFTETTYQKPVKEVVLDAVDYLLSDLDEMKKTISKL